MHVRDDDDVAQMFGTAYMVLTGHAPDAPTFDEITMMTRDVDGIVPADWIDRSEVVLDHLAPDGVDPDDVVAPDVWRRVETTTPAWPRRWVRAATFAAALLVVVGGLVVASRDSESVPAPAVTEPVPSLTVAEPVAPPSVVDALGYRWSRVADDEVVFGVDGVRFDPAMTSVTAGGPGLVAVGTDGSYYHGEEGHLQEWGDAAVWTSVDAVTWSRVPHDEAVFGGAVMSSVTVGGPGLVAVGWFEEDGENGRGAAVWTSVDGFTWSRVPHDETVFGGEAYQWMTSVTAGGPGLVAVGFDGGGIFSGEYNAPVWTSVDGLTWTRVPIDEAIIGGTGLESVTAGSRGLVAVGGDANPRRSDRGARVLTSPDGITWSRVPHETFFSSTVMTGVTAAGPGLVAVGATWNTEIDAAVWIATPEN